MATAFIIRPFGTKQGVDFERVESELIDPSLAGHRLLGRTTGDALRQGNVRPEMLQQLLTADVVVVDISIGNPSVFYELGIRHALCRKRTFLIRGIGTGAPAEDVPFDLSTDRYLAYPIDNPALSLAALRAALRETLLAEDADSPVFQLLPELGEQDRSRFRVVPPDFQADVQRARRQANPRAQWGDLLLLRAESDDYPWQAEGLRLIGRAQLDQKAYAHARDTWEMIRRQEPADQEANIRLGTIYQRLGELTDSNLALQRVLDAPTAPALRAETYALLGSNWKNRWQADCNARPEAAPREAALRSPYLAYACDAYRRGFREDLNHYCAGINALSLLTVQLALASALPEVWEEKFAEPEEGRRALEKQQDDWQTLRGAVALSLEAAKHRLDHAGQHDPWLLITLADLAFLTSDHPGFVATQYRNALIEAPDFARDTVRRQMVLYQRLGIRPDSVAAVLTVVAATGTAAQAEVARPPHVLLFTGHRIDAPDRPVPRFPANQEEVARQDLRDVIAQEQALVNGPLLGIAGGASGGDLLFHEVCRELSIPTLLYLAMPREPFVRASVQDSGPGWVERFDALYEQVPHRLLAPDGKLPRWLQHKRDYTIWQRNNLWMLYHALALGSQQTTLIALWDEAPQGDGPGGTQDMVMQARQQGARVIVRPTKLLFGLG